MIMMRKGQLLKSLTSIQLRQVVSTARINRALARESFDSALAGLGGGLLARENLPLLPEVAESVTCSMDNNHSPKQIANLRYEMLACEIGSVC
jgi:hypothetical protein